ncbi:MAG: hypothetical protein Aurels2KO_52030 [Aureliella sp.]
MKRHVRVTSPAYHDLISNHTWWAENRSARQADSWFEGFEAQMFELETMQICIRLPLKSPLQTQALGK